MEDVAGSRNRCRQSRGGDRTPGASASAPNPATAVEGAEITIALGSEPTSLDPHIVDDGGERAINDNIYETLLARTPDGGSSRPCAALPTQVDDTTWEFALREGVTFHNGEPFNADSVVVDDQSHGRPGRAGRDR